MKWLLLPLLAAAAPPPAVQSTDAGAPAPPAERLFEDRLDPDSLDQALEALAAQAALKPQDERPLVLLARAEAFWAELHRDADAAEIEAHLGAGIRAAGAALALTSPRYGRLAGQGKSLLQALAEVEPSGAEALFWVAADQHRLAAAHGLAWLLLEEPELRRLFRRVLELAPATYYGGAWRHLAELDLALPTGFGSGLAAAAGELSTSARLGPGLLETHLIWAERWAVKAQDYRVFQRELALIRKSPPGAAPEVWPENELCRRRALELAKSTTELFTRSALAAADGGTQTR